MQISLHLLGTELLSITLLRTEEHSISLSDLTSIQLVSDDEPEADDDEETEDRAATRKRVGF